MTLWPERQSSEADEDWIKGAMTPCWSENNPNFEQQNSSLRLSPVLGAGDPEKA